MTLSPTGQVASLTVSGKRAAGIVALSDRQASRTSGLVCAAGVRAIAPTARAASAIAAQSRIRLRIGRLAVPNDTTAAWRMRATQRSVPLQSPADQRQIDYVVRRSQHTLQISCFAIMLPPCLTG